VSHLKALRPRENIVLIAKTEGSARLEDYPQPSVTADTVVIARSPHASPNVPTDTSTFAFASAASSTPTGADADTSTNAPLQVLLIRRGREPYRGSWALPGGFVQPDETVGEAAARELEEETGISGCLSRQIYTFSEPGRDPRGWVITVVYLALVSEPSLAIRAGDDAADAAWFTISYEKTECDERTLTLTNGGTRLSARLVLTSDEPRIEMNDGLAFDHAKIIACALEQL
jgi:ADP-ribose pyrophosphatase YjhB (NUDIX family)